MKGRILAIDYGAKRIGLAVSDPDRTVVFPREVLMNVGIQSTVEFLSQYCEKESISLIVVGFPRHENHSEAQFAPEVRRFISHLQQNIAIPVAEEDEKFTSAEAHMMMEKMGVDASEQKKHRDVLAAMIILQSYLAGNGI